MATRSLPRGVRVTKVRGGKMRYGVWCKINQRMLCPGERFVSVESAERVAEALRRVVSGDKNSKLKGAIIVHKEKLAQVEGTVEVYKSRSTTETETTEVSEFLGGWLQKYQEKLAEKKNNNEGFKTSDN